MADPVTAWAATGAAASIIQIVEFATKLGKKTYELLNSSDNALKENRNVEDLTLMHSKLADQVWDPDIQGRPLNATEKAINDLTRQCKSVSSVLLKLLETLKIEESTKGPKRAWQSVRKVTKTFKQQPVIEQKQRQLHEINGQLSTAMLLHLKEIHLSGLEDLFSRLDDARDKNALLVMESKEAILKALDSHQDRQKCAHIIDSLRFPEMHLRRNAIPAACQNTFSWLFTDSSPFQSWLASSKQLFWVTGKAGSGKSTLMKFVAEHPNTKDQLLKWAGEKKLVVAQNYMWHPGLAMQRNEQGMLQELLLRILQSNLDLIKSASPYRWNTDLLYLQRPDPWSRDELVQTLDNVFEQTKNTTCYCLFIDGLDEYEGERSRLIATIKDFSRFLNVKICISSRPWTVFCSAFEHLDDKIYLHDLTHGDIDVYVAKELGPLLEGDAECTELMSKIVKKASGVFLWVFLVVRSLREGLEEGDSIDIMRQRVDEFPTDLDNYFTHILARVSTTYKAHTAKALGLAVRVLGEVELGHNDQLISFLSFWLLSQGHLDTPQLAFRHYDQQITRDEVSKMVKTTKKYLNACCKDFLHVVEGPGSVCVSVSKKYRTWNVEFLHRTVYDFLHSVEMIQILDEGSPTHFKRSYFTIHVALACYKLLDPHDFVTCRVRFGMANLCLSTMDDREQHLQTMVELEKLAIHWLDRIGNPSCTCETRRNARSFEYLCLAFAACNLHTFNLKMFKQYPQIMSSITANRDQSLLEATLGLATGRQFPSSQINLRCLQRVLEFGDHDPLDLANLTYKLGLNAEREAPSWSAIDTKHMTRLMRLLTSYGVDIEILPSDAAAFLKQYV